MRILYINISKNWQGRVYKEYPLGLGIIATLSKNMGHEVKILDMAVDDSSLKHVVDEFQPDVTGLSFLSTSANTALHVISELKKLKCGHLIAGGIHATLFPDFLLSRGLDIAVIGEGELVIGPLFRALAECHPEGSYNPPDMCRVPGIKYRDQQGNIIYNPPENKSVVLDDLPQVDRDLFNLKLYNHHSIISSRGCIHNCNFCCSWGPGGKKGRFCSPEKIIMEIDSLVNKYGELKLYWADDMFFFNHRDRIRFCRSLAERKLPIKWTIQVRPDDLNDELVEALATSGCEKIAIGAESGSDQILTAIRKRSTVGKIESGINCALKGGLKVKSWWIIGLPGGSYEEQKKAIDLIDRSRPNEVAVHMFVPLPGSEFWNNAVKYGIHRPSMDNIENLFYYSNPGDVKFDYLSTEQLSDLLDYYIKSLENMGYLPTDKFNPDHMYYYTSPVQRTTFSI